MILQHNNWSKEIAVYIHWPFCLSKCPYCDFNSHVAEKVNSQHWLECYLKELNFFSESLRGKYIPSIFFGGGTPSLMEPKIVEQIIDLIGQLAIIDQNTEITLEANPTSFENEKFKAFKLAGINRVSIGVQALRAKDLAVLGRNHNVQEAMNAIESVQKIFPKNSFDLIYARPGQTLKDWQQELAKAMKIAGKHLSLYQLTIEKGTPFYKLHQTGDLILPDNDVAADMYEWTNDYLHQLGMSRYEISNYASSGHECQHNLNYWQYNDYLGIGPGAHSRISWMKDSKRTMQAVMMYHGPDKWLKYVDNFNNGIQLLNVLTPTETIEEMLMMGLRLTTGINLKQSDNFNNLELDNQLNFEQIKIYQQQGLLEYNENNLRLTDKGLMMHNYIVPRLLI